MLTLQIAQLLPQNDSGRPVFEPFAVEWGQARGRSIFEMLDAKPLDISYVIHKGRAIHDTAEISMLRPLDGDEVHVIPAVGGKNAAIIAGVIGGIIGYLAAPYTAGASLALEYVMAGWAIGSTIGSLLVQQPHLAKQGDGQVTSYLFQGITNTDQYGVPVPVILGQTRTGGVRISTFIRRVDSNNVLQPKQEQLNVLLLLGHGPVQNIDTTTVKVNGKPATDYPDITFATRNGVIGQTQIPGFNAIRNTFAVGPVDLTALADAQGVTVSYTYTTNSTNCDAFEVLLTIPGLFHQDNNGSITENTVGYMIEYQRVGASGWNYLDTLTSGSHVADVKAKTRSNVLVSRRLDGLTPGQYNIRITGFETGETHLNPAQDMWHINLTGITEENQDSRTYDGYALLALQGIASESFNGAIPDISVVVQGVKLPYYDGAVLQPAAWNWAGEPNLPVGQNPAWATMEVLRNATWGCGTRVTDANINFAAFKAWADFCQSLANVTPSQGSPYTEPRAQLDIVLNQQTKASDMIAQLASVGRAAIVFSNNQFSPVVDQTATPVQVFTMGNIRTGTFGIQYSGEGARTNTFDVTINNVSKDYDTDRIRISSKQRVVVNGDPIRSQQIQLPGITRVSHAVRDTTYRLNCLNYLRRTISFEAGTDAILAEAGDVISFSHDVPQYGFSGTVMPGGDATHVYVDQPLSIDATLDYEITIRPQDGSQEAGWVGVVHGSAQPNGSGIYNILTLASTPPFTPQEGDLYAFGSVGISTKPYRIISITRSDQGFRKIQAIEYNQSVLTDDPNVTVINYSQLPLFNAIPNPITVAYATEQVTQLGDGTFDSTVLVQWTAPANDQQHATYDSAKVQICLTFDPVHPQNAVWSDWTSGVTEARYYHAPQGYTIGFKIIPRGTNGKYNSAGWVFCYLTTTGHTTPPNSIANFQASVQPTGFLWTWNELANAVQYEIRSTNANWGDSVIGNGFVWRGRGQQFLLAPNQITARSMTLYMKAIDAFGNVSVAAVSATANLPVPGAPSFTSASAAKATLRFSVAPPTYTSDQARGAQSIRLWASTTPGFTPSSSNQVAQQVGPNGGDFVFQAPNSVTTWYFRAAVVDFLTPIFNDFVYSPETNLKQLVITMVDPTTVLVAAALDTQPRGRPVGGGPVSQFPGNTVTIQSMSRVDVFWSFTESVNDPPNSLYGFDLELYTTDPTNPSFTLSTSDPAARAYSFYGISFTQPTTLFAAVRAKFADGIVSDLVSSSGSVVLTPNPTDPPVTTTDTPLTTPYVEEFVRAASLPTGFTTGSGVSALTVDPSGSGKVTFTVDGSSNAWINWDLLNWTAQYADTIRTKMACVARMRLGLPVGTGLSAITVDTDTGNSDASTRNLFVPSAAVPDDGSVHGYLALFGAGGNLLTFSGGSNPHVKIIFQGVTNGTVITLDSMDLASFGYGLVLENDVDRVLSVRQEFAKVGAGGGGPGGGLVFTGDTQIVSADGSKTIISDNGVFFSNISAALQNGAYRVGQRGVISNYVSGATIGFDAPPAFPAVGGYASPVIPDPVAINKFRIVLEKIGSDTLHVSPTNFPVREWIEAVNFIDVGQKLFSTFPQFQIMSVVFEGGDFGSFTDAGPWSQSTTRKSALALQHQYAGYVPLSTYFEQLPGTIPGAGRFLGSGGVGDLLHETNILFPRDEDAWYHGKTYLPSTDVHTFYYRVVLYLNITTPSVLKSTGQPYWTHLYFRVHQAEGLPDTVRNRYVMNDGVAAGFSSVQFNQDRSSIALRVPLDGATRRFGLPFSNWGTAPVPNPLIRLDNTVVSANSQTYVDQCFTIAWWGMDQETGTPVDYGASWPTIAIDVQFDYLTPHAGINPTGVVLIGQNFSYTTFNEF